jgi:hypothetical protein
MGLDAFLFENKGLLSSLLFSVIGGDMRRMKGRK